MIIKRLSFWGAVVKLKPMKRDGWPEWVRIKFIGQKMYYTQVSGEGIGKVRRAKSDDFDAKDWQVNDDESN